MIHSLFTYKNIFVIFSPPTFDQDLSPLAMFNNNCTMGLNIITCVSYMHYRGKSGGGVDWVVFPIYSTYEITVETVISK